VHSVALGQLGEREVIVSGGRDGTVRVWEPGSYKIWASIFMDAAVHSIALSGTDIVAGTSAGIAVLRFA
jgi:WD40 repeat protein